MQYVLNKIKSFFTLENEAPDSFDDVMDKSEQVARWKALAIDKTAESEMYKRQLKAALDEVNRLERINACQAEWLAERGE